MTYERAERAARLASAAPVITAARADRRRSLHEHEGYALLDAFGVDVPAHRFVGAGAPITSADLAAIPGDRLVLKAVGPGLLHKSDIGGVLIGPRTPAWAASTAAALHERLPGLAGCLLVEFVPYDTSIGGELLASARLTSEFGPVVTLALGGTRAEFLSARLHDDAAMAALQPGIDPSHGAIDHAAVTRLLLDPMRGSLPRLARGDLLRFVGRLQHLAEALPALGVLDCEINPAVIREDRLVALDALVTLADPLRTVAPRPLQKLGALLRPRRIAIVGVSDQLNPGRIILQNVLRDGMDPATVTVIKPGRAEIDGCRCVPSIADLPAPVDLLVIAVGAGQAAAMVEQVVERQLAESIIVIPGGFEEKDGSATLAARMRSTLDASRATPWGGPLVVGGNCLGVRSRPGRYDTLFIPDHKLPSTRRPADPVAVVAQSGAFAIARISRWGRVSPRYVVTAGNQMDVTIGDVLSGLSDDPEVNVFAVYVEGFRPLDGVLALDATRRIVARGGSVIVYRAGRTPAGASASASHTASIAGDYRLTRTLFRQAGALVADTLDHFDDLVLLAWRMGARRARGRRLAAVSNAGFECVAMADWLGSLSLASWAPATVQRITGALARLRVSEVVDVHNPLDVTPMTDDEGYEAVVRAALSDPGVDLGVVGCVPLTAALNTVSRPGAADDVHAPDGIVTRLGRLWAEGGVPWVTVVDSGARFDPMADALDAQGVPVFRTADRALRALGTWASRSTA